MNRGFLKELGLDKNVIDAIMAEYGREKQKLLNQQDESVGLYEENETLKEQISELKEQLEGFDNIKTTKTKLEEETKKQQLEILKMRIAYEARLPLEFVERMEGTTEEEIRKDAEFLAEYAPKPKVILPLARPPRKEPSNPLARMVRNLTRNY